MDFTTQTMINTMLGLIAFLGGWVMHSFKAQLNDNKNEIKAANDRLHAVELLVAGKYITREELQSSNDVILSELKVIQKDIRTCMLSRRHDDPKGGHDE